MIVSIRGVMSPALYPDLESDFQDFGNSVSGSRSSIMCNHNTRRGYRILAMDPNRSQIFNLLIIPDPASNPSRKKNHDISSLNDLIDSSRH